MTNDNLKKLKLPETPGVYLFTRGRQVLYVGKATSLRDRVKSYFSRDLIMTRSPLVVKMVAEATGLKWQETNSVLEALILEASLIKKYQPKANTEGKDDKSFNFVVLTNEAFPVLKVVRGKNLLTSNENYKKVFGPFPHSGELKEALKIIRPIFPYRDERCHPGATKPCFNYQIGLCPGTCIGAISKSDYQKVIRSLTLLFEGQTDRLVKDLERHMKRVAKLQKFEEAGEIKKKIFALQHIQDIALLKRKAEISTQGFRIEAYDVAHTGGQETVGVMIVVEDGETKKSDYRKFKIRKSTTKDIGDTHSLEDVLTRRLGHPEWPLPQLIVLDGALAQLNAAKKVLAERGFDIELVAVTKDERHRAKEIIGQKGTVSRHRNEILLANAEAHRFAIAFHRKRRGQMLY